MIEKKKDVQYKMTTIPMKQPKPETLSMIINKAMKRFDYSVDEMATCLGMSESTFFRRKNEKTDGEKMFSLAELEELTKRLRLVITIENGVTKAKEL